MIRRQSMRCVFMCLFTAFLALFANAQGDSAPAVAAAGGEVQSEVVNVLKGAKADSDPAAEALVIPEDITLEPTTPSAPSKNVEPVAAETIAESDDPSQEAVPAAATQPLAIESAVTGGVPAQATAADIMGAPTVLKSDTPEDVAISVISSQEATKRQAYKTHLRQTLTSADTALKASRYEDAIGFYEEARRLIRSIGNRPEDRAEKDAAEAGLAESYYRQAIYLKKRGNYEEAAKLARLSTGMGHLQAPKLAGELRAILENPPKPKQPQPKPRWKEPEYQESMRKISDLLRLGRQHMTAGELRQARTMFEAVLAQDPENTEAIRMIEKIGNQAFDSATAELEATRANMMADVRRGFNPRDYGTKLEERDIWQEWEKKQKQQPKFESDRLRIIDKMKTIKIPEIDFRQANINDVITFLQQQSVECDETSKADEEKGVNIILNLAAGAPARSEAAPAALADPFAMAEGKSATGGEDVPLITFSARYISLYEALKIVTDVSGLKFTVSGSVVMVLHRDAPEVDMLTRMYDVLPSVGERIGQMLPAFGRTGARREDFIAMDQGPAPQVRGDWKEFFSHLGVGWPTGSSIKHIPEIGKIIVKNTPDNLTTFESVLSVINVIPYQIEIEARFVEVTQKDLQTLGFEWNLTDNWEVATKKSSSGDYLGAQQKIQVGAGSFTTGLRYGDEENNENVNTVSDALLTVSSVLTNPELELVLHALQQKTDADLLSAPKVTTQSGMEATLKVVTEYIYPTSFTLESNSTGGNNVGDNVVQNNIPIAVPEDFETREVGVILSVLPEVSPEGQMINLTMSPEVVTEPEWYNYGATYFDENGNEVQVNMPQPFFHTRRIETSISVYNGATVVMGGLIGEARLSTEDKIPFLGDIPLIGRLFRSTYDNSTKRNLLIFVTARLVDPAGRPVKRTDTLGDVLAGAGEGGAPSETTP